MKKIVLIFALGLLSLGAVESEKLYKHCVVCHGKQGELVAIKSSPKLASLGQAELSARLKKVLDGSTSLSQNYLAMHQVKMKNLTPQETDAFAKYITELGQK
ncbi:MAG: c-type cytochrome [Sulfurimonas sp.]|nr:c-type cytochrome [Sulfurimonas sp.]MDD3060831.1 c-type cytochrome [Sulfurimonas sp.]MDD5202975.1 c-type cytochrome [Sulfurimonas sp.]